VAASLPPRKKEVKKPEVRSSTHDPFAGLLAKGKGLETTRSSVKSDGMDLASFVAPGSAEAEKKHQEKLKAEEKQRQEKLAKEKEEAEEAARKAKGLPDKDASPQKEKEDDAYKKHLTKDGYQGRPFGTAFTCSKCGTMGVSTPSGISPSTGDCGLTGGAHVWKSD